ncbi:MAG: hypothetical protein ACLT1J_13570 [Mediterraneibacter gnavus]
MLIEQLREITYLSIIIRVCVAVGIGGIIGLERGMKNQPAGSQNIYGGLFRVMCGNDDKSSIFIMFFNQAILQD